MVASAFRAEDLADPKLVASAFRRKTSGHNCPWMMLDLPDPGFRIVDGVLDLAETSALLRTLEASELTRSRAGARHLMKHPAVARVASDPRLMEIARGFLGPSPAPYR